MRRAPEAVRGGHEIWDFRSAVSGWLGGLQGLGFRVSSCLGASFFFVTPFPGGASGLQSLIIGALGGLEGIRHCIIPAQLPQSFYSCNHCWACAAPPLMAMLLPHTGTQGDPTLNGKLQGIKSLKASRATQACWHAGPWWGKSLEGGISEVRAQLPRRFQR